MKEILVINNSVINKGKKNVTHHFVHLKPTKFFQNLVRNTRESSAIMSMWKRSQRYSPNLANPLEMFWSLQTTNYYYCAVHLPLELTSKVSKTFEIDFLILKLACYLGGILVPAPRNHRRDSKLWQMPTCTPTRIHRLFPCKLLR
jgi:hypothetical protein